MQPSDRQNEPASNQPIQTTGVVGIRPGVSVQESRQERQEPVVGMRGDIPNPLTNPVTAARIRRLASISDNPQAEIDRIEAAQYMANFTRFSPATILRNFDAVSREFIGQTYSPGSVLNQMRDAWRSTRLQQEAGELMSEAWFSRNPREYIERATAILDQAPPTPQNINVFQQVANATARTLPWFVNPIPWSWSVLIW